MKRSRLSMVLAMVLVLLLVIPAVASASTVRLAYSGGSLNLRKGPGTGYASVGYVHNGDSITVLKYGDVWSKVKTSGGKTGYIKNLYINDGDDDYAAGTTYISNYKAYVTATVNFRAGAGTDTKSMGTLKKGAKVTVLGKNGSWYLVSNSAGTQGFVHSKYLSKTSSGSTSSTTTKTITGAYVNMRKGGGLSYAVVATLTRGTKVTVLKKGNYWTQVKYKTKTGWVKNTYLK